MVVYIVCIVRMESYIMITHPCKLYPFRCQLNIVTGVYRGIHYFLIFALKHRLWALVRTASFRQF